MNLFQTKEYLNVFKEHFGGEVVEEIWEKTEDRLILLGMKPVLGGQEVTDFAKTDIKALPSGFKRIQLDYVREDCETYQRFGPGKPQEVSPYLNLPGSWEEYLAGLKRRNRKELKRKLKRLETVEHSFETENNLEEFFRLHRLSDPAKNKFMSREMAEFFKDVWQADYPDWKKNLSFLKIEGEYAAGIMSFISQDEWWLYNSGYDPRFSFYSAGLLLKAWSIRRAIELGKKRYDFLRGRERYKYELGAKDLQLYRIEISR